MYKINYNMEGGFNYDEFNKCITIHDNIIPELNIETDISKTIFEFYDQLCVFYINYKILEDSNILSLDVNIDEYYKNKDYRERMNILIEKYKDELSEFYKIDNNQILQYIDISKNKDEIIEREYSLRKDYDIMIKIIKIIRDEPDNLNIRDIINYNSKILKLIDILTLYEMYIPDEYINLYEVIPPPPMRIPGISDLRIKKPEFKAHKLININIIDNIKYVGDIFKKYNITINPIRLVSDIFNNYRFWMDLYNNTIKLVETCNKRGNKILYYKCNKDKMMITINPVNMGNSTRELIISEHLLIFRFPSVYLYRKYLGLTLNSAGYNLHKYAILRFNSDYIVSRPLKSINFVFEQFKRNNELTELDIENNDINIDKNSFCLIPTKLYKVNKENIQNSLTETF